MAQVKFGVSNDGKICIDEQTWSEAALLLNVDDMKKIISDELVTKVNALGLLAFTFHEDSIEYHRDVVMITRMMLCEFIYACLHKCATSTIGERFVQQPERHILWDTKVGTSRAAQGRCQFGL
jgi:hypothetical protein